MRIKKGDFVRVVVGKFKGTEGQIVKVDHATNRVCLEEMKTKKNRKPSENNTKGKIVEIYRPIHVSNVMALDPKKKVVTRIGYKLDKNKKKVRFAKKTGQVYAN